MRRAVVSSHLKHLHSGLIPLTSPEGCITSSGAENCRKMVLHSFFSQPHEDSSLHACGKFSFHTNVGPAMLRSSASLLSVGAKCCHPALCKPKVLCWKLWWKILCILIMPAFIFFNIMGLSCPQKPSSLDGWGLADIKFGRKLCIPVSAMLHHIPACPSHCTSTSNHVGFWWVTQRALAPMYFSCRVAE